MTNLGGSPNTSRADLAHELIDDAMAWLRRTYPTHGFGVERDLVWTLHRWLSAEAAAAGFRVWTDYPMVKGPRRALSADIALVETDGTILSAAEFKFEPSHTREDVQKQKLPVIGWAGVLADIVRISDWVSIGRAGSGWAVCVDEGGVLRAKGLQHPQGDWEGWGSYGRSDLDVYVHRFEARSLG